MKKAHVSRSAWARVRLFALDVDGILTDGSVYIGSDGTETKRFSIIDGLGLVMLRKLGVEVAWISGRASGATTRRAAELKITLNATEPLLAPVASGQRVGTVTVRLDDRSVAEFPLIALAEVPEAGFLGRSWDSLRLMFNRAK